MPLTLLESKFELIKEGGKAQLGHLFSTKKCTKKTGGFVLAW